MIKFACAWEPGPPAPTEAVADLCRWRDRLRDLGLVGHDEDHDVGYGNLSVRARDGSIYVTGTQTGHVEHLDPDHLARITDHDVAANRLACTGPVRASSESLTHLALYDACPTAAAVIHVHARDLWTRLRGRAPTTPDDVAYGTPAMAEAVGSLARAAPDGGVLVMAGHPDGIVAYGSTFDEAGGRLLAEVARSDR